MRLREHVPRAPPVRPHEARLSAPLLPPSVHLPLPKGDGGAGGGEHQASAEVQPAACCVVRCLWSSVCVRVFVCMY